MSDENVEIVRRWIDAFNDGGIEKAIGFMDPEIEWTTTTAYLEAGTYHGHDGVRQFVQRASTQVEDVHVDVEEMIGGGEDVVVPTKIEARSRQGGAPIAIRLTVVVSLRDGSIILIRNFANPDDALAAARIA
jgi:ketosteroid isomerase-like protein